MKTPNIYRFIKTPCGRAKYEMLKDKKKIYSKIRLYWFIIFAIIKDWNLTEKN